MPPKGFKVSKKRKASSSSSSSGSQSTLDAYRRVGPTSSKQSRDDSKSSGNSSNNNGSSVSDIGVAPMAVDTSLQENTGDRFNLGTYRRPLSKRITVTNLKDPALRELSDDSFEEVWSNHRQLLLMIFKKEPIKLSLQLAYEACEMVCYYQRAEDLYRRLEAECATHIQELASQLISLVNSKGPFLETVNARWERLCDDLTLIRNIFMDLDRRYLIHATKFTSLVDMGKQLFRRHVMENEGVQQRMITDILNIIQNERDGEVIDRALIHSLTQMLFDLDMYRVHFEPEFIKHTEQYYRREAERLLAELSIPDYLFHAKKRYTEEGVERIDAYLVKNTKGVLVETVTTQLVRARIIDILDKGFDDLMDQSRKEPLRILYESLVSSKEITQLRAAFGNYIKRRGIELVKDPKNDSTMITSLLSYKSKIDIILNECFSNDPAFANSLKESFETFINSRKSKPAELLAKFIDNKLRSTQKKKPEEDLEQLMDRLMVLFRYLQGKDAFEAFYKRFLSKRLLLSRSASSDLEKSVLSKLKAECGPGFTKNLEAMFKDIEVSADLNSQFKSSEEYPRSIDIQFQVNVLAQGIWPAYPVTEIALPPDMVACQVAYEKFYTSRFKGRRLTWQNGLSSCVVKANYEKGVKELTVSLAQTIVLLLFNDTHVMSYSDIAAATNIEERELKRVLQSLSLGQHKLLIKEPPSGSISTGDTFKYNVGFTAPSVRLKVNMVQQEQTTEESKATETKVLVDRQHQLEAAIVRIMKAKKKLTHTELMNELFKQVKFPLEAADIKKRIESLIDREYMGRDEDDTSVYVYK